MTLSRSVLAGIFAASALYAQSVTTHYMITDLGPVGGPPGQPFVIKDNSLVSGSAGVNDTTWHAVLWLQEWKIDIGNPGLGGPSSAAFGISERGQAVGEAETATPDPNGEDFCGFGSRLVCHPFVWQNGVMTALPLLTNANGVGGTNGAANAINNRGQAAGISENGERDSTCPDVDPSLGQYQQFKFKPVMWESGLVKELPTVAGDPDGLVFAINNKGQSVGATGSCTAFQSSGDLTYLFGLHATLWENGKVTDLGSLGAVSPNGGNSALNINNRGDRNFRYSRRLVSWFPVEPGDRPSGSGNRR
ncbi:MAG TPA: hypothetical protein VKU01_33920 [Bryobacteraceae bacterium]|nr:hypothetical protein [Bryobacteraceae bacterium]